MSSRTETPIKLSPLVLQAIRRKAKRMGQTPSQFIEGLVARDRLLERSLGEILHPLRQGVERSGIAPEAFEGIVERARKAHHATKRRQ